MGLTACTPGSAPRAQRSAASTRENSIYRLTAGVPLQVTESRYVPLERTVTRKAEFISFNAVECAVPVVRSYLISISNNGVNDSRALLFIPFDSACSTCNIFNTSCTKIVRSSPLVSQQQPLPCV